MPTIARTSARAAKSAKSRRFNLWAAMERERTSSIGRTLVMANPRPRPRSHGERMKRWQEDLLLCGQPNRAKFPPGQGIARLGNTWLGGAGLEDRIRGRRRPLLRWSARGVDDRRGRPGGCACREDLR